MEKDYDKKHLKTQHIYFLPSGIISLVFQLDLDIAQATASLQ
jgi:hypothetical protein